MSCRVLMLHERLIAAKCVNRDETMKPICWEERVAIVFGLVTSENIN